MTMYNNYKPQMKNIIHIFLTYVNVFNFLIICFLAHAFNIKKNIFNFLPSQHYWQEKKLSI